MSKRKITLDLSGQRCKELLKTAAKDFNNEQKTFTISERNATPVLRTYISMQKRINLLDCRIGIHSKDGRTSLDPSCMPSVSLLVYLVILLLVMYSSRAIYSPVNAETIFCIFLFIAVPSFFCVLEMKSYNRFWEHFSKIAQQWRIDPVCEAEQH